MALGDPLRVAGDRAGRTVVRFRFPDVPASGRDWWLVIDEGDVDVCGPADLRRAVPRWFTLSGFAGVPRPAAARSAATATA